MGRYFIRLSYRGTAYNGWQSQTDGHSVTVQQVIQKALSSLTGNDILMTGCGRTDTGVHARGYYAHFDSESLPDPATVVYKLNRMLPDDIAIHAIVRVHDGAHARFDAVSRSYQYHLHTAKSPFMHESWSYPYRHPDPGKLNKAAAIVKEYTDFATFCKSKTDVRTTTCHLTESYWISQDDACVYRITADRFLRGMIRLIVGMSLNFERGKLSESDIRNALESGVRTGHDWSVPPEGLMLCDIQYPYLDGNGNYIGPPI